MYNQVVALLLWNKIHGITYIVVSPELETGRRKAKNAGEELVILEEWWHVHVSRQFGEVFAKVCCVLPWVFPQGPQVVFLILPIH